MMAWVLPLVMLASWSAQAVGMFCRMEGSVVRSGCCCGATPAVNAVNGSEISSAACCEVVASQAPAVVPVALPSLGNVPPVLPVLFAQLLLPEPAVVPPGGLPHAAVPRAQGKPLPLLKRSFLI